MKKNNVVYVAAIVVVVLLLITGGLILGLKNKRKSVLKPTPTPRVNLIETALKDRPYVSLTSDAEAHQFTMRITRLKFGKTLEYEFSYQTKAGLSQGAIGTIELKGESTLTEKFLLGACSRNVCRYDEGVEKGTLVLRFRSPEGMRKFTTDFHLQKGMGQLTSVDGNFKLAAKFPVNVYYLTMPTVGLPGPSDEEILAGPYGIFSSGTSGIKEGKVSLSGGTDSSSPKLRMWDGSSWKTLKEELAAIGTFILSKN